LKKSWFGSLLEIVAFNPSNSFLTKMDQDLPAEFKYITGKDFNKNKFKIIFDKERNLELITDSPLPYGRLNFDLYMPVGYIETAIIWYDKVDLKVYHPSDNVEKTHIEFHWENLPSKSIVLDRLAQEMNDLREELRIHTSFPIMSFFNYIARDSSLEILLKNKNEITQLYSVLQSSISKWNSKNLGLIHSIDLIVSKDEKAIVMFDMGTAGDEAIKYLLEELERSNISIIKVEFNL
jgi:hypothetical protein